MGWGQLRKADRGQRKGEWCSPKERVLSTLVDSSVRTGEPQPGQGAMSVEGSLQMSVMVDQGLTRLLAFTAALGEVCLP